MKRFKWPLQRLLDVTIQRERALEAELLALSREMAEVHQEIFRRQTVLRTLLTDLASEEFPERIPRQRLFLDSSKAAKQILDRLRAQLEELQARREAVMAKFIKIRASRETLERIREEARQQHIREQLNLEQKALDESAQISFARNMKLAKLPQEAVDSNSIKVEPCCGPSPLGSSTIAGS